MPLSWVAKAAASCSRQESVALLLLSVEHIQANTP